MVAAATLIFAAAILGFLGMILLFAFYAKDLPSPEKVVRREGFATKIFDRNGELLYDVFDQEKRTPVKIEDIPLTLKQATIAIEDKNFYKHQGFDPLGYVRAVYKILFFRKIEGGSTLTQQLVKTTLLTPSRTITRKLKELVLTLQVERRYSKDEILLMYLNEAPYGGTAWGVEAAAETYFDKPVTYLTGLRKGFTASYMIMDTKTAFPGGDKPEYVPENYDGKFRGPVTVREALGNSLNVPAVKMLSLVGLKDTLETAFEMGFTTLEPTAETMSRVGLSLTLGGGEVKLLDMAVAYSAFANGGKKTEPVAILKVTDNNGKVLEEFKNSNGGRQVLSQEEAFIISSILSDPEARAITFGTRSSLNIPGHAVAVKTGTTNLKKDNWTVGWTPGVVAGVWVGNNDNTAMKEVASGITGAAPIWRRIIIEALKGKPAEEFERPAGIVEMEVDRISGYGAHDGFPARKEYFIRGTEPQGDDPIHKKIKVCKGDGKLATPADIASNNYDEKEAFYLKEADPFSKMWGGKNKWQEGIDSWLTAQADPKYHPPTDLCGTSNPLWITIAEPGVRSQISGNDVKVRIEISDPNFMRWVEVYLDGEKKHKFEGGNSPWEITIANVANGIHKIDVKAEDDKGNQGSRNVEFGVNQPWSDIPSPTP